MTIEVEIRRSVLELDEGEVRRFHRACNASFFYDWGFLCAAERAPLLPIKAAYYLLARDAGELVGFLPAYLQSVASVDPFGLLQRTAGIQSEAGQSALFSHVMHCFDSRALACSYAAVQALMTALHELALECGAQYAGLLNVVEEHAQKLAAMPGFETRCLVDRYFMDLAEVDSFDVLVRTLPKDGRYEMTRQLRKFGAGQGAISVVAPPFDRRLRELTALCQQTTARNGTPQYFPAEQLARFVTECGQIMRLVLVEDAGEVVGGLICFIDGDLLCIWSAGMRYDLTDYSPYTICFAHAYQWALREGMRTVEAGRLNERIKTRLGLQPLPLYSVTRALCGVRTSA